MSSLIRYVGKKVKRLHKWEPDMSTVAWCERNIYLNSDVTPLTGMARFDDTPHIEDILSDFDRTEVWQQLLNFSTQSGKTHTLLCAWAKAMSTDPSRMQWSIKNTSDVVDYLQEKILPFLRGVKPLQDKIQELSEDTKKKQRAASINVFSGGTTFTGTTAAEKRSKSVKYLFMDEIALYDKGAVTELIGRTKAFERYHRKVMACSSRRHAGDEMDANYGNCETTKEWHTYCPSCEGTFYAGSANFKFMTKNEWLKQSGQNEDTFNLSQYRKEALKDIYVECPNCGNHIDNSTKDKLIYDRKYRFVIVDGEEHGRSIAYKANALAVRITSFETIATIWINAEHEGDPDVLSQFFIDYFNEFAERKVEVIEANDLLLLGNGLKTWEIPDDCYKIFMGVDTQKDYFVVEVKAFCYGRASHSIFASRVESFSEVEDVWLHGQNLPDQQGNIWMISAMGIDRRGYNESGVNRTDEVDNFVLYMQSKYRSGDESRVYATEGHPVLTGDRAIQIVNAKDLSTNRYKLDIKIMKLNNKYLKDMLFRSLDRSIKKAKAVEGGEGHEWKANLFFINQEEVDRDSQGTTGFSYTRQMVAETLTYAKNPKTGKTATEKTYVRIHKHNHFIDTSVICEAFAEKEKVGLAIKPTDEDYKDAIASLVSM